MGKKVHTIHSLPGDSPWEGGLPPTGSPEHPRTIRALDRVLAIQRPAVVAHLRSVRLRHPNASTVDIVRILERRYLAAITTGGAAVGATAVVPGIGTSVTLALSGIETIGFLEATTLFAQSVAEVHGLPVENPDRARALVLTLMLGKEGVDLVAHLAGQARGTSAGRDKYWGELITKSLPRAAMGPLVDRLKSAFVHQFASRGGASFLGKALPFGVGAVVGGAGNHLLGRRVLTNSRRAFGIPPTQLPLDLEPPPDARRLEASLLGGAAAGARRVGTAVIGAASTVARGAGAVARGANDLSRGALRRGSRPQPGGPDAAPDASNPETRESRTR